jgi:NADH-quinone oxidoreductase subunit E
MADNNGNGRRPGRRPPNGKGPHGSEPKGSALYEVIKGIDFERRQLVDKPMGIGLLSLAEEADGRYKCYACTLCERTCPVDAIELEYCPEFPEEPFDIEAARTAALATLPGASCSAASACVIGEQPADFQAPIDMKLLDPVIAGIRSGSGLVEAMHATQETYGYLPRLALEAIAEEMHLGLSRVYGVASFYSQFRLKPVGKYVIDVCMGTACHVAGAPLVLEAFSQELDIPVGDTTPDGLFTLQTVNCVGACALAPVVRLGVDETFGRVGPNEARRLVRKLRKQEAVV